MRGTVESFIPSMNVLVIKAEEQIEAGTVVDIEIHREKRSLNANAYFHKMCSVLADKMGISNGYQKNLLLRRYGQYQYIDGKIPTCLIKSEYDEVTDQREDIHLNPVGYEVVGEDTYTRYATMRGSHTYDTKEMSRLIEGLVSECREQGIETLTPEEQERMMALWERNIHLRLSTKRIAVPDVASRET